MSSDLSVPANPMRAQSDGAGKRGQAHLVTKRSGRPYGAEAWITRIAHKFGLESTLRPPAVPANKQQSPDEATLPAEYAPVPFFFRLNKLLRVANLS